MKTPLFPRQTRGLALVAALVFGISHAGWALPAVQSVEVQPTPLQVGNPFSISVAATDVAQAVATVDFRPWSARILRVTLSLQGSRWTGSGLIPADLVPPAGAEAVVKVLVLNAARARAETTVRVPVVLAPVITAVFDPGSGILTVTGDPQNNVISVGRDGPGNIRVNNGSVPIVGGLPTLANTTLIRVFGRAGNDQITLDTANGSLPPGDLRGEEGDDSLVGGNAVDDLSGGPGNDTLIGRGANDRHFGGDNNDVFVWNPGDGSDLIEGQAGTDTLVFNGSNAAEQVDLAANGARLFFVRNVGNITMDVAGTESIQFNALGGADTINVGNLAGTGVARVDLDLASPAGSGAGDTQPDSILIQGTPGNDVVAISNQAAAVLVSGLPAAVAITGSEDGLDNLTLNALAGEDLVDASNLSAGHLSLTLQGGLGDDILRGSEGNDLFLGGDGDDLALAGAGDDTLVWNPGDDNDTFEGQAGFDVLLFNGANVAENIDLSANGGRVRFFRNVASVFMDLDDVEGLQFNALGGADTIAVNNLAGTDLLEVGVDLRNPPGSGAGDAQPDTVIVQGTQGGDTIQVAGSAAAITVSGLPATLTLVGAEGANDTLFVQALGGNDSLNANALSGGLIQFRADGGGGSDVLIGSRGNDVLFGGDANDLFVWNPGDGSDVIEGQGAVDTLVFNGSNAAEQVNLVANGARAFLLRNVGNITMDIAGTEIIQFNALGGADAVTVGDLAGTGITQVDLDLASPGGSGVGDGQPDTVVVNGTNGDDVFGVADLGPGARIFGLPAAVSISGAEGHDALTLNALGGDDVIDATSISAGRLALNANGGLGDDIFLGSPGDDQFLGGDGDDLMLAGAGNDLLTWNPGDDNDTFEGQDGFDTLLFNGANVAENIDISANGGRVLFFRNVASVVMDLNDVEGLQFNALGGADTTVVNDLSGTDLVEIGLDLALPAGSGNGDAQPDAVIVQATNGDDVVLVTDSPDGVTVLGLSAQIFLTAAEAALDRLTVNLLGGDDVLEASGLPAGRIQLIGNGGDDDDVLIGSGGPDVLSGGDGDDVLLGGDGLDVLDGGPGDNIVIQ